MATALTFTIPLKQDSDSQQRLQQFIDDFSERIQPTIDATLVRSEIVHFARLIVVDNRYLQVITEFDGEAFEYSEFFRRGIGQIFELIFSLVEDAPPWEDLNNPDSFFEYVNRHNLSSLGTATVGNEGLGYLFSACGDATVRQIKSSLGHDAGSPG